MPRAFAMFSGRTVLVENAEGGQGMAEFAQQRPLNWVGLAARFTYERSGIPIGKDRFAYDPSSIRPLLLALVLAESDEEKEGRASVFVVDLRRSELRIAVEEILRLPYPFVAHDARGVLFCLFRLGLSAPNIIWDTRIHEMAVMLGLRHRNYRLRPDVDEAEHARLAEEIEREEKFTYSLMATCQRHAVDYPTAGDAERLNQSLANYSAGTPFSTEQVEFTAGEATAVARLYPLQIIAAMSAGILNHLVTVEMLWVETNARMMWRGVRVDTELCRRVNEACQRHLAVLEPQLAAHGISNVLSHRQLEAFCAQHGLLDVFRRNGKLSFDRHLLADFQHLHPALPLIRAARRIHDLLRERILTGEFIGTDGRIHPEHRQLGTHTGRQSCRWPNLVGLGRVFRPLVVPASGRGIGEVDLSQIEVGVTAAVFDDRPLIEMYNTGDVYAAMAQHFYREELSDVDRTLPGEDFKKKHQDLRDRMKGCTLGIIYGRTVRSLARYLDVNEFEAADLQRRFLEMFPSLKEAMDRAVAYGELRGYALLSSGLRRYRPAGAGSLSIWEQNWMRNTPVQGSAAVVFKAAGNRLDKLYRHYDAWLILPIHDAYVFEAPLSVLASTAELTKQVMCKTVQEYFPKLVAKAEVNIRYPERWNKEGHVDSVERWIEDPSISF
jgi:DNA polymerase-1